MAQKSSRPEATAPLATWLRYIENVHYSTICLGLERTKAVAEQLNLLQPAPFVFTVAGTNGKGTTCRVIEMILLNMGYRVGVYSSPHLLCYTERVRIQGKELSEQLHVEALAEIDKGRGEIQLTYFEFSTLSALKLFQQANLDVVILEVGLGGRLDATNIIDSQVAVITSIALDHTELLGNDRESIGREKAGIFRSDRPAIVGEPNIPASIPAEAELVGAIYLPYQKNWFWQAEPTEWKWWNESVSYTHLPIPKVPLANAATALAAISYSSLKVTEQAIRHGLVQAELPGRFQVVMEKPMVILDVAHNPHAAAYLAEKMRTLPHHNGKVRAIVAMLNDKDIANTVAYLIPIVDQWYCAPLDGPRGTTVSQIAVHLPEPSICSSVKEAWQKVMADAKLDDIVLVFGSFHTVAQVMELIDVEKANG